MKLWLLNYKGDKKEMILESDNIEVIKKEIKNQNSNCNIVIHDAFFTAKTIKNINKSIEFATIEA